MASLDLGTLVARIKVEGAETAKSVLKSISSELGKTEQSSKQTSAGVNSFTSAVSSGIGNISLFGTNLGTLATAFGGSEIAAVAMGTALGGIVTAGFTALIGVAKQAITAMIDFAKSAAEVGVSYQKQMSVVQAISGATSDELKLLGDTARQMGKDTIFSAKEVAQGLEYTSLAGIVTAGFTALIGVAKQAITAMIDFAKSAAEVGVSYQKQMSVVQAISGATSDDLKVLGETARQMGKDTIFSATEVAQAMEYTSLAGWTAQESIEGLPGILNLAAASNMDLAKASDYVTDYLTAFGMEIGASDYVTDYLTAFGMEIGESTRLADIMAYTMSNTNTSTLQLGEAYKNCAATASTFGLSAEETSAWIGVMANASIKGGEAGTALNAVLARLYGETKTTNDAMMEYGLSMYDAEGNAKNFTQVLGEMQEAMKGMTTQQKNIFLKAVAGVNHLSNFSTMMKVSANDVKDLTTELENSAGTSERMAKTMANNIDGLQKSIASKTDDIKLSLFDAFSPLANDILLIVDNFVNQVATGLKPLGTVIGGFFNIFTPIFEGINQIGKKISDLLAELMEPFTELFTTVFGTMGEEVGFFVDIIVAGFDLAVKALKPFVAITSAVIEAITQLYKAAKAYIADKLSPFLDDINSFVDGFKEGFLLLPNIVLVAVNAVIDILNKIPGVAIENVDYLIK